MDHTVTVQLPSDLAEWLHGLSKITGLSPEALICNELAAAKAKRGEQPFMRLSGSLDGLPPELSAVKGYNR